jgi:glycolate oxidase iron-sulfur subunit
MDGIQAGEIPLNETTAQHFDSCLGCLACVSTCPSGVQYDRLIAATRPQVERNVPRSAPMEGLRRLIFSIFPYPGRLRALLRPLGLYQTLGIQTLLRRTGILQTLAPQLAAMESFLPPVTPEAFTDTFPPTAQRQGQRVIIPAQGQRRYRVGLILGCVQRVFNPGVNQATIAVLTGNGCEVVIPLGQGCCGALSHHQGQEHQAQTLARDLIDQFSNPAVSDLPLDAVLINASGCGHTLKEYGQILQDDPTYAARAQTFAAQVKDVQEFLAEVGLTAPLYPLQPHPVTLVYQDACHMLHGQKIYHQPRQLLRQIPGVTLKEPVDGALCCGSAGIYNILQPEIGAQLGQQKVKNLVNTGADIIASANIGCFVQISHHLEKQGHTLPVLHPMQLLAQSMANRGVSGDKVRSVI